MALFLTRLGFRALSEDCLSTLAETVIDSSRLPIAIDIQYFIFFAEG